MILLLESDYALARKLIREIMLLRHEPVWPQSTVDAVRLIKNERFDAAILAIGRTTSDRLGSLDWLSRSRPETPVMALIDGDMTFDQENAIRAGARICLVKPFTVNVFRKRLRDLLTLQRLRSESSS